MLVVLALVTVRFWRLLPVRVDGGDVRRARGALPGRDLLAGGHEHAGIKLPWYWLQTLPVTGSVIPDRFSIIADGAAAAAFAFGFDAARARGQGPRPGRRGPRRSARCASPLPARAAAAPAPPRPPRSGGLDRGVHGAAAAGPRATSSSSRSRCRRYTEPLRWQADTGEPASMVGGYFMGPTWSGQAATDGNGLSSEAMYLNQLWARVGGRPASRGSPPSR